MFSGDRLPAFWPRRYYYGWAIVATSMAVNFAQVGEFNPVLAVFMIPLNDEFGWSRTQISSAIAVGSILGGLMAPFAGPLLDRKGPRTVLVAGQIFFGGAMVAAAFIQELWQFYATYNLGRAVVLGVTSMAIPVAVANWFQRDRPMAMGITQLGGRVGMAILPLAVQLIIDAFSWRVAFAFLGILVWVVGVVPAGLFLRRRPEDVGLRVDGLAPRPLATEGTTALREPDRSAHPATGSSTEIGRASGRTEMSDTLEESWTLAEARRTPALWLLLLSTSMGFMVGGGINLHMVPYFIDQGIPPMHAVGATTVFAVAAGAGGIGWGIIARRFSEIRYALAMLYVLAAAGMMLILTVNSTIMGYLVSGGVGLMFGGMFPLISSLWPDYFGRSSLGAITGFISPFQLSANASGPVVAGFLYDRVGNYQIAFTFFACAYLVAAVWVLFARPPRRPEQVEGVRTHSP